MRDRRDFAPYFRRLADLLALKDWRIDVLDEPPSSADSHANVHCVYGRKWARVRLSEGFLRDTGGEQRHTACHELIHCHYAMADGIAEDGLDAKQQDAFRRALEYATDGLADAIAPLMPLPSDVLDGETK